MSTSTTAANIRAAWTARVRSQEALRRVTERTIVVLHGGASSEREVSLVSGRGMLAALNSPQSEEPRCAQVIGVEISADGRWLVAGRVLDPATALCVLPRNAIFLLGLHGGAGEDGRLQAFLEVAGRIYTGSGAHASALCMDKHLSRLAFAAAGLSVAAGQVVRRAEGNAADASLWLDPPAKRPWFVKPVHGGSSLQTVRAEQHDELVKAVLAIHEAGDDALIEECISGLEVTVAVVGNRASGLRALPLVEILPRRSPFFDYREKYSGEGAIEICPARHLAADAEARIAARALCAYRTLGCDGYARIDFIVPTQAQGNFADEPVILEANSLPGFTPTSLVPKEALAVGVSYRELLLEICWLALERANFMPC